MERDTIVIVLADHGDMLGERGLWYKMSFFENSTRIPLIVHCPKRFEPKRVADPVSLVDVLPSLIELTGTDTEMADPLAGRSFAPLLTGESDGEHEVIGEYMAEGSCAPIIMIRRGPWKFIHCPVDPDQLFNLDDDPQELVNLATSPEHTDVLAQFRLELEQRWDLDRLTAEIIADQTRRRVVGGANRVGKFTPWDWNPPRDIANEYMRNHFDLNEVERLSRFPR